MRRWLVGLGAVGIAACGGGEAASPPTEVPRATTAPPATAPPVAASDVDAASTAETPPAPTPAAPAVPPQPATQLTADQQARLDALAAKAAPFVAAFSDSDAVLSRDAKHVLFTSDRDGVDEPYVADAAKPTSAAKALASGPDRAALGRFTPDDKLVLFLRDHGGDERFHAFRAPAAGGDATDLTPGEARVDAPHVPRQRAAVMVYATHGDDASTSIMVAPVAGGEARKAYVHPSDGFIADVSPDGGRALLIADKSNGEQVLYRVDLDEGHAKRIFPLSERKEARIGDARYSSDGKRVYLATDDGSEWYYLLRIEPGSGVLSGRYKEETVPKATIARVAVSPGHVGADRVAIEVDAGNHTELRVLDDTLKVAASVKLPTMAGGAFGEAKLGDFSPDGKVFTATVSLPDRPREVVAIDAQSGAVKPLRADPRPTLAAVPRLDVSSAQLQAADGLALPVDVILPAGKKDKLPTVVFFHDAPGSAQLAWRPLAAFLASQGYGFVAANVRGSDGFGRAFELADNHEKRAAAVGDAAAVNAWARAQTWCDGDRVVALGVGYGGYLAAMALAKQPGQWRAGVDLGGPTDLAALVRASDARDRARLTLEIGDPDQDSAMLAAVSPLAQAGAITAPLLVAHGENDARVPRAQSDALVASLRARNSKVEYWVATGEGHWPGTREARTQLLARVARFLEENAGPVAAAAAPTTPTTTK
jgi:dipeptidyl aminopeptidase/acylaminoacyl peptidase